MHFNIAKRLSSRRTLPAALAATLIFSIAPLTLPQAQASELADAKSELSASIDELSSISSDIEASQARLDELSSQIDAKASDIEAAQVQLDEVQSRRDEALVDMYKLGGTPGLIELVFSSQSFDELLNNVFYAERVEGRAQSLCSEQQKVRDDIDAEIARLHEDRDAQEQLSASLDVRQQELSAKVAELKGKVDALDAQQRASYAAASELAISQAFASGDVSGWQTGTASAYGGWSDDQIASNAGTATGEAVTETSMGVAIPMAWDNFRSYYGRKVEISYNGQSVIATVNDCGGMGGGSRALDLQPGVFRAFGFDSCDAWGLRTVSYRFL